MGQGELRLLNAPCLFRAPCVSTDLVGGAFRTHLRAATLPTWLIKEQRNAALPSGWCRKTGENTGMRLGTEQSVPSQVDTLASQACLDELRDEVLHRCVLTCAPFLSGLLPPPLIGSFYFNIRKPQQ